MGGYLDARRAGFFANSQVEAPDLYVDPDTFTLNKSVDQLNARFRRGAVELGKLAVLRALERAGLALAVCEGANEPVQCLEQPRRSSEGTAHCAL